MRENKIQEFLRVSVTRMKGLAYKIEVANRAGVCDMLCMLPADTIFFVECKSPGKSPRTNQWREIYRLRELGIHAYVADSIEDVRTIMMLEATRMQDNISDGKTGDYKLEDWKDRLALPYWFS
jgi:hypothetical protein